MTAATPSNLPSMFENHHSRNKHGVTSLKNPANSQFDHQKASRKRFAALLWRAFPSRSEGELAQKASRVLDVSPRQVRNWLRCEHDAAVSYVFAVMAVAGAEIVFRKIEGSH